MRRGFPWRLTNAILHGNRSNILRRNMFAEAGGASPDNRKSRSSGCRAMAASKCAIALTVLSARCQDWIEPPADPGCRGSSPDLRKHACEASACPGALAPHQAPCASVVDTSPPTTASRVKRSVSNNGVVRWLRITLARFQRRAVLVADLPGLGRVARLAKPARAAPIAGRAMARTAPRACLRPQRHCRLSGRPPGSCSAPWPKTRSSHCSRPACAAFDLLV
jgi:hypothetical protein